MSKILLIYIILLGITIIDLVFVLVSKYRLEHDLKELDEVIKRELEEMTK